LAVERLTQPQHFAFAGISDTFEVELGELQDMFDEFKQIRTSKRIISFSGWSFSTDYDTFPIFHEGVTPEQRQLFATNVVQVCVALQLFFFLTLITY
jgi:chitinase